MVHDLVLFLYIERLSSLPSLRSLDGVIFSVIFLITSAHMGGVLILNDPINDLSSPWSAHMVVMILHSVPGDLIRVVKSLASGDKGVVIVVSMPDLLSRN